MDIRATPQGCLQALASKKGAAVHYCSSSSRSGVGASQQPNRYRSRHSCEDGDPGMKRRDEEHGAEKGSATDSAVTWTHSLQSCTASAGQIFSLLIKRRIWHQSQDAALTVRDRHAPQADIPGCAVWQISLWTRKTNPFFPPCQVTSCFLCFKEKKEFLFFCWVRYLVFSSDLFVLGKQKGLRISLLCFSTIQNTKDASSKAVYNLS